MDDSWHSTRAGFEEAVAWFLASVDLVDGRWQEPGLGEWDVRALVGHTSRSLITVENGLDSPAAAVEIATAAEYYLAVRSLVSGPAVTERGRQAGRDLGENPPVVLQRLANRVLARTAVCEGAEVVTTIAGGMSLAQYLRTRVLELVVHSLDLRAALGVPGEPPTGAGIATVLLAAELGSAGGSLSTLLLALTGRGGLPAGFTVL